MNAEPGRIQCHGELAVLELRALSCLDLVLGQLDRVLDALQRRDLKLVTFVIAEDERLDDRHLEVHQRILSLLAQQASVAGDLRLAAALLHLIKRAERMGDQCVKIAKLIAPCVPDEAVRGEMLSKVMQLGETVRVGVMRCKYAFAERDIAMAEGLVARQRDVDGLNHEVLLLAVEAHDGDSREGVTTMTLVARALERIGADAVDIGEQTVCVVTGLFRELCHTTHVGLH